MQDLPARDHWGAAEVADATTEVVENVLETLELVDAPPEEAFDKFTRLVSTFLNVPVSLVSFVEEDRDRQFFKSEFGLTGIWAETRQTPLSHSFCQYVKRDDRPLIVEHAPDDARVCNNLAIPDLNVRAYLGVPVHGPDKSVLGALCAIDAKRRRWDQSDVDVMVDLAGCVTDQIRLRHALRRSHGL
ncbi:hypothetical protein DEA8626_01634 [Defluviimonas aquaemixtae]|uniref:GAF domain-containing protein n=1 Tax=Albidovulum aquaemixtae TaxID=1542388 RepID=A0A2R8B679_9RHOB|nr:GAF domain-containing protein [Defluviimonas aquaemixtae]SPH18104.1 hypothetical protein DEA8626_01634 [Defluviimonas aquaemixtae]